MNFFVVFVMMYKLYIFNMYINIILNRDKVNYIIYQQVKRYWVFISYKTDFFAWND